MSLNKMVHYQRYHSLKKGEQQRQQQQQQQLEEEYEALAAMVCSNNCYYYKTASARTTRPKLLYLLFLSLLSCSCCLIILTPNLFCFSSPLSLFYSFGVEYGQDAADLNIYGSLCSSISSGSICCDRTGHRTDICFMKGDVRTNSASSSIFVYISRNTTGFINHVSNTISQDGELQHEKIKPYTRKWEKGTMDTVGELNLLLKTQEFVEEHHCDVMHDVPAIFFSTAGYTGNVYHEFNDGILPLYITSQHFNKKVVLVIQEYHSWWIMKYADILSQLSDYPPIDFSGDKRTHCFPEAIVGLRIHDELTVDPSLMEGNKTIADFRNLLDHAYWPRIKGLIEDEEKEAQEQLRQTVHSSNPSSESLIELRKEVPITQTKRPKLVILSRNGSRAITNQDLLVKMAEAIGYLVEVLRPDPTTELAKIYRSLNSSDVMIGVHGAAMTHLLFMNPGSVFIQVIPLGTEWAAENYYGEPARKLGLKYVGYQILPEESSLYDKYDKNDPVLQNPESVNKKGWHYTKSIYLDSQNVILHLGRFQKWLVRAYRYSILKKNHRSRLQTH